MTNLTFAQGGILLEQVMVTDDERRKLPFYTDYCARFGLGWSLGLPIRLRNELVMALGIQRGSNAPKFTQAEIDLARRLARHVERALGMTLDLYERDALLAMFRTTIEKMGVGLFIIDRDGVILGSNALGLRHATDGALRLEGRQLQADRPSERTAFNTMVQEQVAAGRKLALNAPLSGTAGALPPRHMLLTGGNGQGRLAVSILPITPLDQSQRTIATATTRAAALVLTSDLTVNRVPPAALVRQFFDLTETEGRVAALIGAGCTITDAADATGMKEATARTHLARIFSKTNVNRQPELVAQLARLASLPLT
jgi:DNA-binding CsgD family transcriptional regulator